ncbi:MAG: N-acetylmuramoyl-L-alanine amidase [Synechococcus lacustris]
MRLNSPRRWLLVGALGAGLCLALATLLSHQQPTRGPQEEKALTPAPPAQPRWHSPLLNNCPVVDKRLGDHLVKLGLQVRRIQADPSNYSLRLSKDAFGQALDPTPAVIVIHETVYSLGSAINTFTTPHPADEDQVSYHSLVGRQGEIIQVVDPTKRAFGAGFSAFEGRWVFTNKRLAGSLNNFGLHVSLETPEDGSDAELKHSGYSPAQYDALSRVLADWMVRYKIKPEAITTHRHVDLGGARADPRSFNWRELQKRLTALGLAC